MEPKVVVAADEFATWEIRDNVFRGYIDTGPGGIDITYAQQQDIEIKDCRIIEIYHRCDTDIFFYEHVLRQRLSFLNSPQSTRP